MTRSVGFLRRRRGMTSLTETVICTILFSLVLVILLRLLTYSNDWTLRTQDEMKDRIDVDYLVDTLTEDVKSSAEIELVDDQLQIISESQVIVYARYNHILYRNAEEIIDNVAASSFSVLDGDVVRVYIQTEDYEIIDLTIHR